MVGLLRFRGLPGDRADEPRGLIVGFQPDRSAVLLKDLGDDAEPGAVAVALGGEALLEMRKHIAWYVHGMHGASRFRERINTMNHSRDVMEALAEGARALEE